ncbi:galactokinase-like, partial [Musca vetustissima]|uniref:galactokinase-like n=1 Tax=Musca vetustissima TaxID=27455 RepID=UPI002AB6518A
MNDGKNATSTPSQQQQQHIKQQNVSSIINHNIISGAISTTSPETSSFSSANNKYKNGINYNEPIKPRKKDNNKDKKPGKMSSPSLLTAKLPTFEEILKTAKETFRQNFGQQPELACCAPGRVNLIGEHVDYNDGYVLPMALPMVTVIVGGQRPGNEVDLITCCAGADDPKRVKFSLTDLQPSQKP